MSRHHTLLTFRCVLRRAAAVAGLLLAFAVTAQAQGQVKVLPAKAAVGDAKRIALVIGNSGYRYIPALPNTINDATAVAGKLQDLGYEVHFARDLDRRDMIDTIGGFLLKVEPGSETLIYYAGHGVEMQGSNYLLPIDIPVLSPAQERLLRSEGTNLSELLLELEARNARAALVIVDACRNNPFRLATTRAIGSTRGLGRVDAPKGTFVIYSAGVGEQAYDNLGPGDRDPNGLFTRKLLKFISVEGLELRTMVRQLRTEVREAALTTVGQSQVPSYYDQLLGDFFFKPKAPVPEQTACDTLVKPDLGRDAALAVDLEPGFKACERAVADFPSEPRFVHLLYNAQEQRALQRALQSDRSGSSEAYLALFPTGRFVADVRAHLTALAGKDEAARVSAAKAGAERIAAQAEAKAEFAKAEAARAAAQAETAKAEAARAEAARAAAQAEAAKREAAKAEAARAAAQAEAAKAEALRSEAVKAAAQAEAAKAEAARAQAAVVAARSEAAKADAAKVAAQTEAANAEAARTATLAEKAKIEAAKPPATAETGDSAAGAGPGRTAVASASPGSALAVDPTDVARLLQVHLKRVGCDPGPADGEWNASSRRALEIFNKQAGTRLDVTLASLDALDAVRARTARVCPLVCARGYRVDGDRCVQISCGPGMILGSDGTCQKQKERPQKALVRREATPAPKAPSAAPSGGGRCFTFNGKRFCE
jgi:Caspase domain